jgi:hypothetical protein
MTARRARFSAENVRAEELMRNHLIVSTVVALCGLSAISVPIYAQAAQWQTPAKWHRTLKKAEPGTLLVDRDGVEFRSAKFTHRWKYIDIHTFDLSQRELSLLTYQNRPWHEPGERPFRFTLAEPMPTEIAAQFTEFVGKPVRNGTPMTTAEAMVEIPAHHRVWSGGSNGILRLKAEGIDYVTESGRDSQSWRWVDIQTIANPEPYEFRITGYREIADFDLKQPLSRAVFEKLWDRLYANGLNVSPSPGGLHHLSHEEAHR